MEAPSSGTWWRDLWMGEKHFSPRWFLVTTSFVIRAALTGSFLSDLFTVATTSQQDTTQYLETLISLFFPPQLQQSTVTNPTRGSHTTQSYVTQLPCPTLPLSVCRFTGGNIHFDYDIFKCLIVSVVFWKTHERALPVGAPFYFRPTAYFDISLFCKLPRSAPISKSVFPLRETISPLIWLL